MLLLCVAERIWLTCKKWVVRRMHENALPAASGVVIAGSLSSLNSRHSLLHVWDKHASQNVCTGSHWQSTYCTGKSIAATCTTEWEADCSRQSFYCCNLCNVFMVGGRTCYGHPTAGACRVYFRHICTGLLLIVFLITRGVFRGGPNRHAPPLNAANISRPALNGDCNTHARHSW